jgi:uncharacterized protein (TIGR03086 family)
VEREGRGTIRGTIDPSEALQRAIGVLVDKVKGVTPEDLHRPTPCSEFDVEALLNHLLIVIRMMSEADQSQPPAPPRPTVEFEGRSVEWLIEGDPVRQLVEAAERLAAQWADRDPSGFPFLRVGFRELLVHAWDVAKAIGQDTTLPDDLATALLQGSLPYDAAMRGPTGFGRRMEVAPDASATDKLAAFMGRQP